MSASSSGNRGGQPSTTAPTASPWLSPQVVTVKSSPKEFAIGSCEARTLLAFCEAKSSGNFSLAGWSQPVRSRPFTNPALWLFLVSSGASLAIKTLTYRMTPRLALLYLTVASSVVTSGTFAQAQPQPPANAAPAAVPEEEMVQLKLPDADIDTVLSALEIYTGRIILRPQQLQTATYNLKINKPIPKSEAILAIETVLALNQIGIAPLGDRFLKVVNLNQVKQEAPEMITGSALDRPASGKVATKIFQLEFLRVGEFVPMVQAGILNPFYGGPVQLQNANAALITDSVSNLQRVEVLLQQLDRPLNAGMKPKFYNVRNVKASDLVNKLRAILTGTLQNQLGSATSYSADDRTQQIIVVTDPRQLDFFSDLIEKLDQKSDPNTRNDVINLKHAKASDVVNVLSRILSGQTQAIQRQGAGSVRPGQGPTPPPVPGQPAVVSASASSNPNLDSMLASGSNEFSAFMTVVNDDRSNSVVVFGTADDIRLINELVTKLDIVLAQVRIEVVIAEVTVGENDQSGISALGLKLDGDKLIGFSGTVPGAALANGTVTRRGGTAAVSGAWDLAAEISINTTPRKSNNTILSHPSIVTSHGKQAKIFNGETRPVVTGTVSAAGASTTGLSTSSQVTQQQIGTTLTITPFIGAADGSVNLDIVQSVEDVIGNVQVDQNTQYIIGRRESTSNVSAKSGEILVFAGYQKQIDTKSTSRFGPIPILGDIFGSRKNEKSHQELIFFLRPTVLTNNPVIDNAETMKRVENLPTRDQIKQHIDPNFRPPPKPLLDRILGK
ncbi:MAG: type II secretory pathway, component PulD [Opitutus sp.]|nr:type II secretory pathway, component PulD [Opitutus sp.]